jgi:diguanylate cyclase (GGDEF)-like protein
MTPGRTSARPMANAQTESSALQAGAAEASWQALLAQERRRRWQLEMAVFDARSALAMTRFALQGARAGERRASHQARHDSLTALPNRLMFSERLDHALASARQQTHRLAVLFLDLDGFKSINDAHGHFIGDEILSIVAARLDTAVRADDVVSRFGGDEFACLLTHAPLPAQLSALACKLFDAVSAPIQIGQLNLTVRPSIGMASYPADGCTTALLLQCADQAMYRAKREQTGYAHYQPCSAGQASKPAA